MSEQSHERVLGELLGRMAALEQKSEKESKSRERIYDEISKIRADTNEIPLVKKDIEQLTQCIDKEIKPYIKQFNAIKNKGWGILAGVALAGGTLGSAIMPVLRKLGLAS